jgi:hypothetical protein
VTASEGRTIGKIAIHGGTLKKRTVVFALIVTEPAIEGVCGEEVEGGCPPPPPAVFAGS